MSLQLSTSIQNATSNRLFFWRLGSSIKTIYQEKGIGLGMSAGMLAMITKIYTVAAIYFCAEGSWRALMEVAHEDDDQVVRLRPFGDASGWMALPFFVVIAIATVIIKVVREGEYLRLKPLCEKWLNENQELIARKPKLQKNLYVKINDLLDAYHSQCLFPKQIVSRRLIALQIKAAKSECKKRAIDKKLKKTFLKIQKEVNQASSLKKYFSRLYDGQKSYYKMGYSKSISSWMMGLILPIIFVNLAIMSYIGTGGLMKQALHNGDEKTDRGHIGEWLFNAIEMIGVALFFHVVSMINEGDFVRTRGVYARHIKKFKAKNNRELHNRLCDLANAELAQLLPNRLYFQLPDFYKFKKYEKEIHAI